MSAPNVCAFECREYPLGIQQWTMGTYSSVVSSKKRCIHMNIKQPIAVTNNKRNVSSYKQTVLRQHTAVAKKKHSYRTYSPKRSSPLAVCRFGNFCFPTSPDVSFTSPEPPPPLSPSLHVTPPVAPSLYITAPNATAVTPLNPTAVTPLNATAVTPLNPTAVTPLNPTAVTPLNPTAVTPLNTTAVTPLNAETTSNTPPLTPASTVSDASPFSEETDVSEHHESVIDTPLFASPLIRHEASPNRRPLLAPSTRNPTTSPWATVAPTESIVLSPEGEARPRATVLASLDTPHPSDNTHRASSHGAAVVPLASSTTMSTMQPYPQRLPKRGVTNRRRSWIAYKLRSGVPLSYLIQKNYGVTSLSRWEHRLGAHRKKHLALNYAPKHRLHAASAATHTTPQQQPSRQSMEPQAFLRLQKAAAAFCLTVGAPEEPESQRSVLEASFSPIKASELEAFVKQIRSEGGGRVHRLSATASKEEEALQLLKKQNIRVKSERSVAERMHVTLAATLRSKEHILSKTYWLQGAECLFVDEIDYYLHEAINQGTSASWGGEKDTFSVPTTDSDSPSAASIASALCEGSRRVTLYAATHLSKQRCRRNIQLFEEVWRPKHYPFAVTVEAVPSPGVRPTEPPPSTAWRPSEALLGSVGFATIAKSPAWYSHLYGRNGELKQKVFPTAQYGYEKARQLAYAVYDEATILTRPTTLDTLADRDDGSVVSSPANRAVEAEALIPEGIYILMDKTNKKELALYGVIQSHGSATEEHLFCIKPNYWEGERYEEAVKRVKYYAAAWFFCKCVEKARLQLGGKRALPRDGSETEDYEESKHQLAEGLLCTLTDIIHSKADYRVGIRWNRTFLIFEYFVFKASTGFPSSEASDGMCLLHEVCQVSLLTFSGIRVALKHTLFRLQPYICLKKQSRISKTDTLPLKESPPTESPIVATDLDKAVKYMVYFSITSEQQLDALDGLSPVDAVGASLLESPTNKAVSPIRDHKDERGPQVSMTLLHPLQYSSKSIRLHSDEFSHSDLDSKKDYLSDMESAYLSATDVRHRRYSLRSNNGLASDGDSLNVRNPQRHSHHTRLAGRVMAELSGVPSEYLMHSSTIASDDKSGVLRTIAKSHIPKEFPSHPLMPFWWKFCDAYKENLEKRSCDHFDEASSVISDTNSDAPSTLSVDEDTPLQFVLAYPTVHAMVDSSLVSLATKRDVLPSSALVNAYYPFISDVLSPSFEAESNPKCLAILKQLFPSLYSITSLWESHNTAQKGTCEDSIGAEDCYLSAPFESSGDFVFTSASYDKEEDWTIDTTIPTPTLDDLLLGGDTSWNLEATCFSLEMMSEVEMFGCLRHFHGFPEVSDGRGNHLDWLMKRLHVDPAFKHASYEDQDCKDSKLGLSERAVPYLMDVSPVKVAKSRNYLDLGRASSEPAERAAGTVFVGQSYNNAKLISTSGAASTSAPSSSKAMASAVLIKAPTRRRRFTRSSGLRRGAPSLLGPSETQKHVLFPHLPEEMPTETTVQRQSPPPSRKKRLSRSSVDNDYFISKSKALKSHGSDTAEGVLDGSPPMSCNDASQRLPTGVYFDASRQLWRCQWRENGRFKTKGFSLAHYTSLEDALMAAIRFRCTIGGIQVRPEWLDPAFANQFARRGNPRRRGMPFHNPTTLVAAIDENQSGLTVATHPLVKAERLTAAAEKETFVFAPSESEMGCSTAKVSVIVRPPAENMESRQKIKLESLSESKLHEAKAAVRTLDKEVFRKQTPLVSLVAKEKLSDADTFLDED